MNKKVSRKGNWRQRLLSAASNARNQVDVRSGVRLRLLREEAEKRLSDANALRSEELSADTVYLVRLLAFELYLKLAVETACGLHAYGHKYQELFKKLPMHLQDEIIKLAGERVGPSLLSSRHLEVLKELGENFVDLRYPYDRYGHLTEAEFASMSRDWVEEGSAVEDAAYRYYPEELTGLLYALREITSHQD